MSFIIQVYNERPRDFFPKAQIAAVYVCAEDKILLLQCAAYKSEGGAWGVPAGKLEKEEKPIHAAKRELLEETGIDVAEEDSLRAIGELYIRKPEMDYIYHSFTVHFQNAPPVILSSEHCSHRWVSRNEAKKLPLMQGAQAALDVYYQQDVR